MAFFRNRYVIILSAVLILQIAGFYALPSARDIQLRQPLEALPPQLGNWGLLREHALDPEINGVLRAHAILNRDYANASLQTVANLFVAYFQSQRQGQSPHSPRHCMPGSGWTTESLTTLPLSINGRTYNINRYVLSKGDERDIVLYWYQSNRRIVASEYTARLYMVADALRYNRTDAALVRAVVRVPPGGSVDSATETAADFVRAFFNPLEQCLP